MFPYTFLRESANRNLKRRHVISTPKAGEEIYIKISKKIKAFLANLTRYNDATCKKLATVIIDEVEEGKCLRNISFVYNKKQKNDGIRAR